MMVRTLRAAFANAEPLRGVIMLLIICLVLLVVALGGGAFGHSRVGLAGWSPAGIIVLVLVVLWLTGRLSV